MLHPLLNKMARTALPALLLAAAPSYAHNEGVIQAAGFVSGFAHPFFGLDHLLAMVAVGWWATQNQRRAVWVLPFVFSMMLMAGLILGMTGIRIPIVESGIAGSVMALGLLIAFAVKLPVRAGALLISAVALMYGLAHGTELPSYVSLGSYVAGLLLATLGLHLAGVAGGLRLSQRVARFSGAGIAVTGMAMLAFA